MFAPEVPHVSCYLTLSVAGLSPGAATSSGAARASPGVQGADARQLEHSGRDLSFKGICCFLRG